MKITLVTATLNSEKYLEQTLRSVLEQDFSDLEYIIVDGGSTDATLKIIEKYKHGISKVISGEDKGLYDALRKGFERAEGDIYGWINSDDILFSGSLKALDKIFSQFPDSQWITGFPCGITEDGIVYPGKNTHASKLYIRSEFLNAPFYVIQQESTFFRSDLYKKVGGVCPDFKLAGDYELWAKFFEHANLDVFDLCIGAFRKHPHQLSHKRENYVDEAMIIREKYNEPRLAKEYKSLIRRMKIHAAMPFLSKENFIKNNGASHFVFDNNSGSFRRQ